MKNSPLRTALAVTFALSLSAPILAACSNDAATTDGSTATVTDTVTPTSLLDLSQDAAKKRREPLPTDLGLLMPSEDVLQELSAGAGGRYKAGSEQVIPFDSPLMTWAAGMQLGFERRYDFESVNEADPMKTHAATMEMRVLVFDTKESASAAMGAYQALRGRAVTQSAIQEDTRLAALRYSVTAEKLGEFSEGLVQRGSVLVWLVFADSEKMNWGTTAIEVARVVVSSTLERYPDLAS